MFITQVIDIFGSFAINRPDEGRGWVRDIRDIIFATIIISTIDSSISIASSRHM